MHTTKSDINEVFKVASGLSEVKDALSDILQNAVIFLDVDDTLIAPQSSLFRASSPYRFLIDELKKDKVKYPNYEHIISHWRLKRKVMLVEDAWPTVINDLKINHPVYALTQMESGSIGSIPSMEKWRFDELSTLGVTFTPMMDGLSEQTILEGPSPATYYRGIFITGSYKKGEVLKAYFKNKRPSQIVLIDDREEHILDALEECKRSDIPFLGILYKGMQLIPGAPHPKVADFQKSQLFNNTIWYEDEEAEKIRPKEQRRDIEPMEKPIVRPNVYPPYEYR